MSEITNKLVGIVAETLLIQIGKPKQTGKDAYEITGYWRNYLAKEIIKQILSHPNIARVDREAKLPNYIGVAIAGTLKDWVREIKDEKL